jgi:hypothetical protein
MRPIRPHPRSLFTMMLMLLLIAGVGLAQTTTATLKGRIVDPERDPVGGVEITAINTDTGNNYSAVSGTDGRYLLAGLRPGTYTVVVASPAYEPKTQTMTVLVGQSITADFNLSPAVVLSESITVVGQQVVEMQTSQITTNITTQQIETLPQNSRNFMNFAGLAPGVTISDSETRKTFQAGAQSAEAVNVFVDGISYKNDILAGGIIGQDASRGNPFPQNAVQEFRVLTQNYSAEFQKASSAVITAVTKSGTNALSGEVFAFFQDDALVDDNPISGATEQFFERIQSGVSVGGPILRDRLHYFLAYEGNDQERELQVVMGPGGANVPGLRDRFTQYEGLFPSEFGSDLIFGKGSWQPSSRQLLDLGFFLRSETDLRSFGGRNSWDFREDVLNDVENYGLRHQFTTQAFFNEASLSYQEYVWNPTPARLDMVGQNFQDILRIGGRDTEQDKAQMRASLRNDLTFSPFEWNGSHSIKVGAIVDFTEYDLKNFLVGNPVFHYRSAESWAFPWRVEYGYGDPQTGADNTAIGLYVQDEWSPMDRLLVNAGVRWDYESDMFPTDWVTPADIREKLAPYVDTEKYFTDGNDRKALDQMFAPRLGLSYDLFGTDRSVVFGGWGRYWDRTLRGQTDAEKFRQTWKRGELFFSQNGGVVGGNQTVAWKDEYLDRDRLFNLLESQRLARPEVFLLENDTKAPYADQWTVGLRQKLGNFVTSLSYGSTRSHNGFTYGWSQVAWEKLRNPNGTCCAWAPVQALGYNNIITSRDDKKTWYDAIYLTVDKPFTADSRWAAGLSYTNNLKAETQGGDLFSFDFPNVADFPRKPLNSTQDHFLVSNALVRLPWNFTVGGVLTYGSGRHYDIVDRSLGTGANQRILYGEGEGSPYTTIDLRFQYDLDLGPVALGLVGEAFNITNDEVESGWQNVIFTLPDVNPRFGEPTNIVANSQRRFQYGLRLRF